MLSVAQILKFWRRNVTSTHVIAKENGRKKSIHVWEVVVSYRQFFFHFFFVLEWTTGKNIEWKRAFSIFFYPHMILAWRMPWPMVVFNGQHFFLSFCSSFSWVGKTVCPLTKIVFCVSYFILNSIRCPFFCQKLCTKILNSDGDHRKQFIISRKVCERTVLHRMLVEFR